MTGAEALSVLAVLVILLLGGAEAAGQTVEADAGSVGPEQPPVEADAGGAAESANPAETPDPAGEAAEASAGESSADSEPRDGWLRSLADKYGAADLKTDDLVAVGALRDRLRSRTEELHVELEALAGRTAELETGRGSLEQQIADADLPEAATVLLERSIALSLARQRVVEARRAGLRERTSELAGAIERLEGHLEELKRRQEERSEQDDEERKQVKQAEKAEQQALEALKAAREQERLERDQEIRALINQRSEILEKTAELAGEQGEQIKQLGSQRSRINEEFARRQEAFDSEIDGLPEEPTDKQAREQVDPLFEDLRVRRSAARTEYAASAESLQAAIAELSKAERGLAEAETDLAEVRQRADRLGESDLAEHQMALGRAKLDYNKRLVEQMKSLVSAHQKSLELHADRIAFYNAKIEALLPKISPKARRDYYSIWENENWRNVGASLEEASRYLSRIVELRLQQLKSLPDRVYSAELWGWLFGFLWRMLLIPLVVYLLRNYNQWAVRRLMDFLLHRRFFRKRAAGTIKLGEMLRSVIWPISILLIIHVPVDYVTRTLPELEMLTWVFDVWFIYWIIMALVKVLFLPRSYREQLGRTTPSPELGRLSDSSDIHGPDVVDIFHFDVDNARKLVRTVRHILIFSLVSWLVPQMVAEAAGHTVLWGLVESTFDWATIGIAYYELSSWRDELADLFRRVAGDRIPRIVEFTDKHKDTPYGLLAIGLSSVFVLVVETVRLGRSYFRETELSQRLANFIFRKKIELKQREREEQKEEAVEQAELPQEYRDLFEDRPLYDEDYLIERSELTETVFERWSQWIETGRQGSIALTGEQGIGKTTLLNQLYRQFQQRMADGALPGVWSGGEDDYQLQYATLTDKIVRVDALIGYLADLFDLDEVPADREQLVKRLAEQPPRIILLDDCHHLFFRKIEGFEALNVFMDVINLTDDRHFWVLTFNRYGWKYLQRVQGSKHFFGDDVEIGAWSAMELQDLIDRRNERIPLNISFTDLVVTRDEEQENYYEVVKTANGYFRLLQEFCQGNPRVAMDFWIRNLEPDGNGTLQVSLFGRPQLENVSNLTDEHLFALTAIVQHGALSPAEVAEIINAEEGFCQMALIHFEEVGIARRSRGGRRYRLTPFYFRPVVNRLTNSNFLWN